MNADAVREAYEAVCAEAGAGRHRRRRHEVRRRRGDGRARRGGDRRRRREPGPGHAAEARGLRATAFRWHFIGALQSNKARVVNEICELVHAVDTDSAARRLTVPWLLEVNLAGEASKSGVARERDRGLRRALPAALRPDDDAAVRRRSGGQPADRSAASPGSRATTASRSSRWARRRTGASPSRRARR